MPKLKSKHIYLCKREGCNSWKEDKHDFCRVHLPSLAIAVSNTATRIQNDIDTFNAEFVVFMNEDGGQYNEFVPPSRDSGEWILYWVNKDHQSIEKDNEQEDDERATLRAYTRGKCVLYADRLALISVYISITIDVQRTFKITKRQVVSLLYLATLYNGQGKFYYVLKNWIEGDEDGNFKKHKDDIDDKTNLFIEACEDAWNGRLKSGFNNGMGTRYSASMRGGFFIKDAFEDQDNVDMLNKNLDFLEDCLTFFEEKSGDQYKYDIESLWDLLSAGTTLNKGGPKMGWKGKGLYGVGDFKLLDLVLMLPFLGLINNDRLQDTDYCKLGPGNPTCKKMKKLGQDVDYCQFIATKIAKLNDVPVRFVEASFCENLRWMKPYEYFFWGQRIYQIRRSIADGNYEMTVRLPEDNYETVHRCDKQSRFFPKYLEKAPSASK